MSPEARSPFVAPAGDLEEPPEGWAPVGRLRRQRGRIVTNPPLLAGIVLLLGFVAAGLAAALWFGAGLTTVLSDPTLGAMTPPPGPGRDHLFGVLGSSGADLFNALWQATPIDLTLVGGSTLLAAAVGILLGSYAGLSGGVADAIVTEVGDLLVGVPPFFFVMVMYLGLSPFLSAGVRLYLFAILFTVVLFPYHARPVRALALAVAGEPYVEAARAAGASPRRLLLRHVLPNSFAPALAQLPIDVYHFLFVLTVFPFLACFGGGNGLFVLISPLPNASFPEWGNLLAQGACAGWSPLETLNYPWMYGFPAAVVITFGMAVTLASDGFERYLAGPRRTV